MLSQLSGLQFGVNQGNVSNTKATTGQNQQASSIFDGVNKNTNASENNKIASNGNESSQESASSSGNSLLEKLGEILSLLEGSNAQAAGGEETSNKGTSWSDATEKQQELQSKNQAIRDKALSGTKQQQQYDQLEKAVNTPLNPQSIKLQADC